MKAIIVSLDEIIKAKHPTPGGWETSGVAMKEARKQTWPVRKKTKIVTAHRRKISANKERSNYFVKEGKFPMGTLPDFKGPLVDPSNPERDAKWRKWAEKHGYTETDTGWESKAQKLKFQALEGKTKFEAQNKLSAPGPYSPKTAEEAKLRQEIAGNEPMSTGKSTGEEWFKRDGHIVRLKPGVDIEAYKARHPTAKQLTPAEFKKERRNMLRKIRSSTKDQIMRDLGLVKVRGAVSGKTYWE